ncbi:MAG: hypothetical protein GXO37_04565, partial [Chloroflexi bacterium]|nr:hypothetical protein [Chloroflexota bacterium]
MRFLSVALFLLLGLGLGARNARVEAAAPFQEEFPQSQAWARATPSVVWCGDRATLEVHIVGRSDVVGVQLTNRGETDRFTLYDDGTHGDPVAGDGVFTLADAQLYCDPRRLEASGGTGLWVGFLRVRLRDGRELGNNYGLQVGLVHPRYRGTFQVHDFGQGLSATAYAFFIQDAHHEVFDHYPVATVYCGKSNFAAYRKLYSVLPDAFDFAVVMPGEQLVRPGDFAENVPYEVGVSNQVRHIGMPIFDHTARFGSAGRLKAAIYLSFASLDIFDHEIAHTWGAGLGADLGLIQEGKAGRFHWNALSDIGGQLGAYYFAPNGEVGHFAYNGDDTWRWVPNTTVEPYAPLELYMMGLIPPEEVPPVHILQDPDLSDPEHITAAAVRTVTIEEIMAAEGGPREPAYPNTPRAFNLAFIVVQEGPFDEAAYAFFSLLSQRLTSHEPPQPHSSLAPFYWATGGRATLDTRL